MALDGSACIAVLTPPRSPSLSLLDVLLPCTGALVILALVLTCVILIVRMIRAGQLSEGVAKAQRAGDLQLRSIANTANLVLANYDQDGNLAYVSPGIRRVTGISAAQFVAGNTSFDDVVHPDDRARLEEARIAREQLNREDLEFDYRLKDMKGRWHWLHVRQSPVLSEDVVTGYNSVAVDFTDRVRFDQQQRRLLHLQQLSTTIVESFLSTSDLPSTMDSILDILCRYFDLSTATIFERTSPAFPFTRTHIWTNDRIADKALGNGGSPEELDMEATAWWAHRLRLGMPVNLNPGRCSSHDSIGLLKLVGRNELATLVVPVMVLGELRVMIVLEDLEPGRDWQPEELAAIQTLAHAIARSMERSSAETERAEFEETRRGHERSEIIAHLASGIAHDFNNIVFAVSGRIQLLLKKSTDEQTKQSLDEIQKTLQGAKGIIGALLAMHRGTGPREGAIRISPEIRAVANMIRRLIPKRIDFDVDIRTDDSLQAHVTAEALHQILMNLVVNSRDAIETVGHIRVILEQVEGDEIGIKMHIDDDGPGIPEEQRQEVFKPFVSTKSTATGTGLGLSIVQRVAREHGGTIELGDSPLGGLRATASFRVVDEDEVAPRQEPRLLDVTLADVSSVLIVEDDIAIRDILVRAFESNGIEVIHKGDALSVLELLSSNDQQIDVVIMDIDLPQKTGIECLEEVRSAGIEIPCVLITGGLSDAPTETTYTRLLRKPFPIETLEATCKALVAEYRAGT